MLTERNVQKYYPETIETAKRHLNQTRKNVRSTKAKPTPLETCDTSLLHGKKVQDVYTETYRVRETMFSERNMFGTCFGETGLKIRPDVFRHDNCEQKKHVLLCKMSPASHAIACDRMRSHEIA